jgi:CHAD domain-containing protein
LARAIADQGARLLDAWPAALEGDPEALRRVRIATRRLRATLPLVANATTGAATRRVKRDLKRVGRALGPSRELLVSREELNRAAREHAWNDHDVAGVERWLDRRIARADRVRRRKLRRLDVTALSERLGTLTLAVTNAAPSIVWGRVVSHLLVRRTTRAARARDACGTLYEPEHLHALRIALKKLRYTVELVDVATDLRGAALAAALKQVQQRYGRLHDRQILLAEVRACAASGRSRTAPACTTIIDGLEAECRRWHGDAMTTIAEVDDCVAGAAWLGRVLVTPRLAPARARLSAAARRRRAG